MSCSSGADSLQGRREAAEVVVGEGGGMVRGEGGGREEGPVLAAMWKGGDGGGNCKAGLIAKFSIWVWRLVIVILGSVGGALIRPWSDFGVTSYESSCSIRCIFHCLYTL